MEFDQLLVLVILGTAVILFITEKLRADLVALLVLLTLIVTGLLTVDQAFEGFASPAVVTVWAVFIISGGLQQSGAADIIARQLMNFSGNSQNRLLLLLMVGAGLMSAFMNNIGAVAILMPAVIAIGRKIKISPSKLLMPLAFAALLGGNMTLIGTPPNILAAEIMADYGVAPFRFFDFLPTGLLVLGAGTLYMLLVGQKLIPERILPGELESEYQMAGFVTEVRLGESSPLIGKSLAETDLGSAHDIIVIYIRQKDGEEVGPLRPYPLQPGDSILMEGNPQSILEVNELYDLHPVVDGDQSVELEEDEFHLAQITLAPNSYLQNRTLKSLNFRDRYGLSVLAVRRNNVDEVDHLANLPIQFGDAMLVQGPSKNFNQLLNDRNLLVLESPNITRRRLHKIPLASVVLLGVVTGAAFGVLPVAALMLAGALLMVMGGVLNMDEAYRAIDWKAVFLIAGMLPLGMAMEQTGTARLLADGLVGVTGGMGSLVVLCSLFVLTAVLTEVISNAAAAVLIVPIAIDVALSLSLSPYPFVMGTVLAASTSFLMPIGHQVNVIIFGAGGYHFGDYARVGVWLNLILLGITAVFVPLIWPFTG